MRQRPVDKDPVQRLNTSMQATQLRIVKQKNLKSPTVEILDLPGNPPVVSIEGQLAQDLGGKLWWHLEGEWRTC